MRNILFILLFLLSISPLQAQNNLYLGVLLGGRMETTKLNDSGSGNLFLV